MMKLAKSAAVPAIAASCLALGAAGAAANEEDWPREVKHSKGIIVVYQPQIDDFADTVLKVRSAISITLKEKEEPTFGAVWAEAKVTVDRNARKVTANEIKVTRVRFPGATSEQEKALAAIIEEAAPKWNNDIDYDRFVASIAALGKTRKSLEGFRNDPPKIIVEKTPAVLLLYDGQPRPIAIEGTKLKRIINTPGVVIQDEKGKWFLYGGAGWFEAKEPMGPWTPTKKPSSDVAKLVADMEKRAAAAAKAKGEVTTQEDEKTLAAETKKEDPDFDPSKPPKVIPVTEPTELILFKGEPAWKPLVEGDILFADNSSSDILIYVPTQVTYLLLSGRWYRGKGVDGPWEFVPPDQLPESFRKIPEDSAKGDLLSHVPGTPQAEEALADAQIPQVAAVKRGPAKLDVRYDGEPKFETIEGTSIEYAKNTGSKVLKVSGKYYACEQAVWYVASSPTGPWEVATSIPDEIQKIPPESPVYNVKYVTIYDTTPEVVYVGYTPAYLGCYPYYGTVVWGTGYPYVPWIGTVYYPHPWTWGFHAHYNPYYGWSFGISVGVSWGWGSISIGWSNWGWGGYYPPYWGPGGYYPVYRPPYYGGYPPYRPGNYPDHHAGNRPSQQPGGANRPSTLPSQPGGANRPSTLPSQPGASQLPSQGGRPTAGQRPANIYDRPENADRMAPSTGDRARAGTLPTTGAGGRDNNVFVNDAGDVYRRNGDGSWDQRVGNSWQSAGSGQRPSTNPSNPGSGNRPSTRPGTQPSAPSSGLQRDYSSRQRGASRSTSYSNSAYRGGMSRGGGGRRR